MTAQRFEQIIVHVGQPKTGTTYIQRTLAANAERLKAHGILYPVPRAELTAHHGLVHHLLNPEDRTTLERALIGPSGDGDLILDALRGQRGLDTAILSSELLFHQIGANLERFQVLDNTLRKLAADVRYVAYARDPVSRFPSSSSQVLMKTALLPTPAWGVNVNAFTKLHEHLGPRFEFRQYNRDAFAGGDVLGDFLVHVVGSDISVDSLVPSRIANVSLSAEGMFLVQSVAFARQLADPSGFPDHDVDMRQFAQFVRRLDTSQENHRPAQMRSDMRGVIVAAVAEPVAQLRAACGIDLMPSSTVAPIKDNQARVYRQLVRNVFEVDPDRTAVLSEAVSSHPKCPGALREALGRVTMPAA